MKRAVLLIVLIGVTAIVWLAAPREPAADRFSPGACREAAESVRSLARITDDENLSAADRAELRRVQDRLVTLAPAAAAEVREPMEALVLTLGYLRLRLDSKTAEPRYVREVEQARARLVKTCVVRAR